MILTLPSMDMFFNPSKIWSFEKTKFYKEEQFNFIVDLVPQVTLSHKNYIYKSVKRSIYELKCIFLPSSEICFSFPSLIKWNLVML